MQRSRRLLTSLSLCLLPSIAAAQILVPLDHPTIQEAVDAAAPGDMIVIESGSYPAFVVDKPLTLVGRGDPPLIEAPTGAQATSSTQAPTIRLDGPGSGAVTLVNLHTGGTIDGNAYTHATAALGGGGFDSLRVLHCRIAAPTWSNLSGFASSGAAGITTTLPWLVVEDSVVIGGQGGDDLSGAFFFDVPDGALAISNQGTVTLLDSDVQGGDAPNTVFADDFPFGCPTACSEVSGGLGGAGVSADRLHLAGTRLRAGQGARLSCFDTGTQTSSILCHKPDGLPITTGTPVEHLPGTLIGSGPITLGDEWSFTWGAATTPAFLLVSVKPTPGAQLGLKGLLFMAGGPSRFQSLPPVTGVNSLVVSIPDDPAFAGLPVVLQTYDAITGLSRPLLGVFVDG